jgi:hypothetical protein
VGIRFLVPISYLYGNSGSEESSSTYHYIFAVIPALGQYSDRFRFWRLLFPFDQRPLVPERVCFQAVPHPCRGGDRGGVGDIREKKIKRIM